MAYGDYWKVVSPKDYESILDWLERHESSEDVDIEAIDVAYLLFGKKYGEEIKLAEYFETELFLDESTGEQYYIDEVGDKIYGDWSSNAYEGYRYLSEEAKDHTIDYVSVSEEKVIQLANDLAQNHWRFAFDLKPMFETITLEEYQEQLSEAGYN